MNLLNILELILGTAEKIVPVFIHNPKSQQIEGVVISTVNGVLQGLTPTTSTSPSTPPASDPPAATS